MESINIAIIEDDSLTRENLRIYLEAHPAITVVLEAESVESARKQLRAIVQPEIDLLFLDIGLPGMRGIDGIPLFREVLPEVDIVMLTTYEEDEMIFEALCQGACAYIAKRTPLSQIRDAAFTIYRGGSYMSPSIARKVVQHFNPKKSKPKAALTVRQKEIVKELVNGLTYQMIADKLNISLDTVRDHIRRIYRLLDVNSKMGVVRKSLDGEI